ncbi:MAG: amphi-Trp domain-containing protein [Myxococcales bacterium]|nr:MAG: amphi-Trp domain-containing protein [Myxococcales bacterium]
MNKEQLAMTFYAPPEVIAEHLEALAASFRNGKLSLSVGAEHLEMAAEGAVDMDVHAEKKGVRNTLSVELRWRNKPELVGEAVIHAEPPKRPEG